VAAAGGRAAAPAPALVTLLGGVLIAVAPFLPWAQVDIPIVGTVTRTAAEEGGGWAFVAGGVLAVALAVVRLVLGGRRALQVVQVLLALVVLGFGLWVYSDVSNQFSDIRDSIDQPASDITDGAVTPSGLLDLNHGVGNYVVLAGAVLVLAGVPRGYGRTIAERP
jgi:hypothetical protein